MSNQCQYSKNKKQKNKKNKKQKKSKNMIPMILSYLEQSLTISKSVYISTLNHINQASYIFILLYTYPHIIPILPWPAPASLHLYLSLDGLFVVNLRTENLMHFWQHSCRQWQGADLFQFSTKASEGSCESSPLHLSFKKRLWAANVDQDDSI